MSDSLGAVRMIGAVFVAPLLALTFLMIEANIGRNISGKPSAQDTRVE
ncbi:hypothetical protein [Paraburkholderia caribensis]|nr:hypothetical protein [Paraburkholderia caribensis]